MSVYIEYKRQISAVEALYCTIFLHFINCIEYATLRTKGLDISACLE